MSIINDALKKVQQNRDRQKKGIKSDGLTPQPLQKEKFSDISEAIIIASFLGSLLILTTFFLFSPKQDKVKSLMPTEEKKDQSVSAQTTLETDPPPAPLPKAPLQPKTAKTKNHISGLTLTGIVKMGDEYVALINNKIVKEGDVLGERRILRINKDEVKIFNKGETISLRLNKF